MNNRLQILDYWGDLSYPHVSFNVLADEVWRSCVRRGAVAGLRRYDLKSGVSSDDGKLPIAAIGLSYNVIFPDAWNTLANWNTPTTLQSIPNLFGNGVASQLHIDGTANPSSPYIYTAQHIVGLNQPHSINISFAALPNPPAGQPKQTALWRYAWGGNWRFEIRRDSARLTRLSKGYTYALDQELDALLILDTRTSTQETRIGVIQQMIFDVDKSVSLSANTARRTAFHQPTTVTFIAEPRGIVRVETGDGKFDIVEVPQLLKNRTRNGDPATNTVWSASTPQIVAFGGVFAWQSGRPQFAVVGTMRLGKFAPGFAAGTVPVQGQWDVSLPNTSVSFVDQHVTNDPNPPLYTIQGAPTTPQIDEFVATLSGDGTYTPFLYSANCFVQAGARVGTTTVAWDSDSHLNLGTDSIMDVQVQFDGEGRKASYTVVLRCVNNADGTNQLGAFPECHDRTVNLWLNGQKTVTTGIIRNATYNKMARVSTATNADYATAQTTKDFNALLAKAAPGATITLEICDPWFVIDSDLMADDPIGDGLYLADYIRLVLQGAGFKDSELTGIANSTYLISSNLGRRLPYAAMGESFAVRPAPDTARSDYLRHLIDSYGMDMRLWWDGANGYWTLGVPPTTVIAAFSSNPATVIPYRIEEDLDIIHDYGDTKNVIQVEGAIDAATGQPIIATWTIWEGFRAANNYVYVGRRKKMQTVKDEALRTQADVNWVLRSLVKKNTRAGRFAQFQTWFIPNFFPLDYVTVDGISGQIERIGTGGISGRMFVGSDSLVWSGKMQPVVRLLQTGEKP